VENEPGKMWVYSRDSDPEGILYKTEDFVNGPQITNPGDDTSRVQVLPAENADSLAYRDTALFVDGDKVMEKSSRYGINRRVEDSIDSVLFAQEQHIKNNSFIPQFFKEDAGSIILVSVVILGAAFFLVPAVIILAMVLTISLFSMSRKLRNILISATLILTAVLLGTLFFMGSLSNQLIFAAVILVPVFIWVLFYMGELRNRFRELIKYEHEASQNHKSHKKEKLLSKKEKKLRDIFDQNLGALSHRPEATIYLTSMIDRKGWDVFNPKGEMQIKDFVIKFSRFFDVLIALQQDEELWKGQRRRAKTLKWGRWILDDEELDNLFMLYDEEDVQHPLNSKDFEVLMLSGVLQISIDNNIPLHKVLNNFILGIKSYLDKRRAEGKIAGFQEYPLKKILNVPHVNKIAFSLLAAAFVLAHAAVIPWSVFTFVLAGSVVTVCLSSRLFALHFYHIPHALYVIFKSRAGFSAERSREEAAALAFKSMFWKRVISQWLVFNGTLAGLTVYFAWGMVPAWIFAIGMLLVFALARISFRTVAFLNFAAMAKIVAEEKRLYEIRNFKDVQKKAEEFFENNKDLNKRKEFDDFVNKQLYGDDPKEPWMGNYLTEKEKEMLLKTPKNWKRKPVDPRAVEMLRDWFNLEFMPKEEVPVLKVMETLNKNLSVYNGSDVTGGNKETARMAMVNTVEQLVQRYEAEAEAEKAVIKEYVNNKRNLQATAGEDKSAAKEIDRLKEASKDHAKAIVAGRAIRNDLREVLKSLSNQQLDENGRKRLESLIIALQIKIWDKEIPGYVVRHSAVDESYEVLFGYYEDAKTTYLNEMDSGDQRKPTGTLIMTRFEFIKRKFPMQWVNFIEKMVYSLANDEGERGSIIRDITESRSMEEAYVRFMYYYLRKKGEPKVNGLTVEEFLSEFFIFDENKQRRSISSKMRDLMTDYDNDKFITRQFRHFANWRLESVWKTTESSWRSFRQERESLADRFFYRKEEDTAFITSMADTKIRHIIVYVTYDKGELKADEKNSIGIAEHIREHKNEWVEIGRASCRERVY
jgi:Ca2+/Na+ antiporter